MMPVIGKVRHAKPRPASNIASVLLPVDNCRARLPSGCGPAAAAAVIAFHRGASPSQEAIATAAGWHPERGIRSAGLAKALEKFLGCTCQPVNPHDAAALSAVLARGFPAIMFVRTGDIRGHAVVLRGMIVHGDATFAVVCDPMLAAGYSLLVPFAKLGATAIGALAIPGNAQG